jgi:membrane protein implicated in regulation of membrane protease activity
MKPHALRFLIGFSGGVAALTLLFATHPFALAVAIALPVFILSSWLADRVFARYATPEQIKRDLEDRLRNPPD